MTGRRDEGVFPTLLCTLPPPPPQLTRPWRVSMGWPVAIDGYSGGCRSDSSHPPPLQPARLSLTRRRSCRTRGVQNNTLSYGRSRRRPTAGTTSADRAFARDVASCGVTVSPDGRTVRRRRRRSVAEPSRLAVAASDLATTLAPHVRHFVLLRQRPCAAAV